MAFETIGVRAVIEGLAAFERASRVIKKELVDIIDKEKELERQNEQVRKGLRNMGLALVGAAAAGGAFLFTATRLAARVETLGIVTAQLGKNVGLTEKEVRALEQSIKAQGITLRATRKSIALMVQANIDLAKGTDLARLAQDAAVIANINSSEAFERLVFVISSGNLRMARTLGLQVSFQQAYKDMAKEVGKAVSELTQQEKVQARTNVVLDAGTRIAGTYAAAMETAGKKVLSLDRHLEESVRILGEAFLPIFADVVDGVTGGLKAFQDLDTAQQRQIATGIAMATAWSGIIGTAFLLFANINKIKSAFTTLALVMTSSFGPIILLLGFLAAVTTAFAVANAKMKENRRQFDILERSAKLASTTYEGYVQETIALGEETGKLVKTQEDFNKLLPVIRQRLLDQGRVIVLVSEATFNAKTAYERYTESVFQAAEETDILVVTQEDLAKQTDKARKSLENAISVVILLSEEEFELEKLVEGMNRDWEQMALFLDNVTGEMLDLKKGTEDLTLSQEELEAQQERLNDELSKLKDLMREDITKGFVEWKTKTEELTGRLQELETQTGDLTEAQIEEMGEIRDQLKKTTEAWREHTANVIFSLAEQAVAQGDFGEQGILFLARLQEELGLVDKGYFLLTQGVFDAVGALDGSEESFDAATETAMALALAMGNAALSGEGLRRAIDMLTSKTVTVTTIFKEVRTGRAEQETTTETTTMPPVIITGQGPEEFQRGGFARAGRAAIIGEGGMELFIPRVSGTILSNQFVNALGNLAHALSAIPAMSAPMPMMAPAIAGSSTTNNLNMNIHTSAPREPIISDFRTLEGWSNAL